MPPAPSESTPPGRKPFYSGRAGHRNRSHQSAQHELGSDPSPKPPDHPLIPLGEAKMVGTQEGLSELIAKLRGAGRFAYDSEFIGELTYIPKLCLIQVATADTVALIDPIEKIDLTAFWELLCDRAVEKVVHAGAQDLEPAFRHLQRSPANIFDTQIAAGFISLAYPASLSKLVKGMTGVNLGKGLTFTHWDQRPLSPMQLRYAADDVRYLLAVRERIGQRLAELGHEEWAKEECLELCDPEQFRFDPDRQCRRARGASSLSASGLAILRELMIWRNDAARTHDVPPRSFVRDEVLVDLSRNPPKSVDKLGKVKGLPRPVELAHGKEIVEAIAKAAATPNHQIPALRQYEETPAEKFRSDGLWAAVEVLSLGRGIDPNLVSSRQEISQLYRYLAGNGPEPEIRLLKGWRMEAIGKPLLAMVQNGHIAQITWHEGQMRVRMPE
jgi:ribonuclease D